MFLLNVFKDLLYLHYKVKCETELRSFFSLIFQWLQRYVHNVGDFKDPLKQDLALEFCRNQNKNFSILTETFINHDQIHHIKNNWLDPIFLSPGVTQKNCLPCFIQVMKVSLRLPLIQDRCLCPLRLLHLMSEFFGFVSLQSITPGTAD